MHIYSHDHEHDIHAHHAVLCDVESFSTSQTSNRILLWRDSPDLGCGPVPTRDGRGSHLWIRRATEDESGQPQQSISANGSRLGDGNGRPALR
jgi:hypothetical protein